MVNIKYPLYALAFLIVQAFVCAGCGEEEEPNTPHDPYVVDFYYDIVLLNNDGTPRIIHEEEAEKLEVKWNNGTDYDWGCSVSDVSITDGNVISAICQLVIPPLFGFEEGQETITGVSFDIKLRSKSLFGTYDLRKITEYCKDIKNSEVMAWSSAFRTKSMESDDLGIVETSEEYVEKLNMVGSKRIVIRLKE